MVGVGSCFFLNFLRVSFPTTRVRLCRLRGPFVTNRLSVGRCWILSLSLFFLRDISPPNKFGFVDCVARPSQACFEISGVGILLLFLIFCGSVSPPQGFGFVGCVARSQETGCQSAGVGSCCFCFFCGTISPPNEVGFVDCVVDCVAPLATNRFEFPMWHCSCRSGKCT